MKFLYDLEQQAKELCPDYPFTQHTPFEYLWALTQTIKGLRLACDDWYKSWQDLKTENERLKEENRVLESVSLTQDKDGDRTSIQLTELRKAAEHVMGDWKNVRVRDRLQAVLNWIEYGHPLPKRG